MKDLVVIVGVIILLLGVAVAGYGQTYVITTTDQKSLTLFDYVISVHGGDYRVSSYEIQSGLTVNGSLTVTPKGLELLGFYVLDSKNYDLWLKGRAQRYIIYMHNHIVSQSFSFKTNLTDKYYFIFDNHRETKTRYVKFKLVTLWTESHTQHPYQWLVTPGIALATAGLVTLIFGLVLLKYKRPTRPPPYAKPTPPVPSIPPKKFCIFCGAEVPEYALVCEKCGKKQE
jgi:hypothetical protein